ncbi:hypothetical protein GGI25_003343 [Coemansia spiralis]|uniref:SH3 domain-containing protein n=2 Tax=Coemansia TaxID=4863 RepID=A0A9W8G759_9FUNG|nr:hypothetical protein EDC05_006007 [Coemansia umbellata]KAJ2621660.1 hypothetical protein GGI26_003868 [Coemansia sp. RSA 1358]KAJ2676808.1 hypothetical protein GGI25_003343 [Coemansia spiralis]
MLLANPTAVLAWVTLLIAVCKVACAFEAIKPPFSNGIYSHMGLHIQQSHGPESGTASGHKSDNATHRCFPLRKSKYCGAGLGNYYMSALVTIGGKHVTNAEDLDTVMDTYFDSPDEQNYINNFFGCQSWTGQPTPRFRIAYTCRSLLESKEAVACNVYHKPPALCIGACNAYVGEWAALTQNSRMCANTTLAELRRNSLADSCIAWPYNGTSGCVSSTGSGTEICGFPLPQTDSGQLSAYDFGRLCHFCKNSKDSCCRTPLVVERCSRKSLKKRNSVLYVALTISMTLVLAFLLAVAAWYMCIARRANDHQAEQRSINSIMNFDKVKAVGMHSEDLPEQSASTGFSSGDANKACSTISMSSALSASSSSSARNTTSSSYQRGYSNVKEDKDVLVCERQPAYPPDRKSFKQVMLVQMPNVFEGIAKASLLFKSKRTQEASQPITKRSSMGKGPNRNDCGGSPKEATAGGAADLHDIKKSAAVIDGESQGHQQFGTRSQSLRGCPCNKLRTKLLKDVPEQNKRQTEQATDCGCCTDVKPKASNELYTVLYPYSSVEKDELSIVPGEQVHILRLFSDGWSFVQRVNDGRVGAIPVVCLDAAACCNSSEPETEGDAA